MPKNIYCGQCGFEILQYRKSFKGQIFDFVEPHECGEIVEPVLDGTPVPVKQKEISEGKKADKFEKLDYVNRLNALVDKIGDRREGDALRKEKEPAQTSTAPLSLDDIKGMN